MNLTGRIIVAQPLDGLVPPQSFIVVADHSQTTPYFLLVRAEGGLCSAHVITVPVAQLNIIAHYEQDDLIEGVADTLARVLSDEVLSFTDVGRRAATQTHRALVELLASKARANTIPFESLSEVPDDGLMEFTIRASVDSDPRDLANAIAAHIKRQQRRGTF